MQSDGGLSAGNAHRSEPVLVTSPGAYKEMFNMAKIYEATLIPTGTTDLEGNYCGYQWCEREAIEGVDSLQGYVSDLDDVEVLDNVTVHNMPAGAIVVGLNGTPCSMIWEELGE